MAVNINFAGLAIRRPGYYGWPWWDELNRELKRLNYTLPQREVFIKLQDTLLRLDLQSDGFWRGNSAK